MARVILTPDDAARISVAVAEAERGTTGEIRCVIADDRDPRRAVLAAVCVALAAPAIALLFGLRPAALFEGLAGWTAAQDTSGPVASAAALHAYVAVQALTLCVTLAVALSPIPRWLTPAGWRKAAVARAAAEQFEALGLANTRERTGVLLYVSLAHRRAEVMADEGVYARAPHQAWDEVIALLVAPLGRGEAAAGLVAAVDRIGEILAAHLPPRDGDRNELADAPLTVR